MASDRLLKMSDAGAFYVRLLPGAVLLASMAVACGESKPPEPVAPKPEPIAAVADDDKPRKPTKDTVPNTPTASAVKISDEILKACGIAAPDAHFAFDSANLRPQDGKPLDQVATCFTTGPLKGRAMKLIGHADPRGDSEHNLQLGLSRANAVGKYLNDKGLDKSKASTTSRGADEAKGTDEASWAQDRRVDVMLGD